MFAGFTGYSLPGRPAVRHRPPLHRGRDPVDPDRRHRTSRSSSSAASSPATTSSPGFYSDAHPAAARHHGSACVVGHLILVFYHKHTQFAGSRQDQQERRRHAAAARCTRRRPEASSSWSSASSPSWRPIADDQPDLDYGPVPTRPGLHRRPARLVHGLRRGPDPRRCPAGRSTSGATPWSWACCIPLLLVRRWSWRPSRLYPFIESWVTGDKREHHMLDRPRNGPTRTGLGVAWLTLSTRSAADRWRQRPRGPPTSTCPINDDHLVRRGRLLRRPRPGVHRHQADLHSASSAGTATRCCTAARPASSSACRTASSSRSTSRSTRSSCTPSPRTSSTSRLEIGPDGRRERRRAQGDGSRRSSAPSSSESYYGEDQPDPKPTVEEYKEITSGHGHRLAVLALPRHGEGPVQPSDGDLRRAPGLDRRGDRTSHEASTPLGWGTRHLAYHHQERL